LRSLRHPDAICGIHITRGKSFYTPPACVLWKKIRGLRWTYMAGSKKSNPNAGLVASLCAVLDAGGLRHPDHAQAFSDSKKH
jgi:hypothetical protein